jgi:hypothetical protein
MSRVNIQSNPKVQQIFEDLEKYKDFCVNYGYKFDEATLYDMRNYTYRMHTKQLQGKEVKDMWLEDMPKQ